MLKVVEEGSGGESWIRSSSKVIKRRDKVLESIEEEAEDTDFKEVKEGMGIRE